MPVYPDRHPYSLERKAIFMRLKRQVREAVQKNRALGIALARAGASGESQRIRLKDYDPLVEIALIGVDPEMPASIRLSCHAAIVPYVYPKVSPDIQVETGEAGITLVIQKFLPAEPKQIEQVVDAEFKKSG